MTKFNQLKCFILAYRNYVTLKFVHNIGAKILLFNPPSATQSQSEVSVRRPDFLTAYLLLEAEVEAARQVASLVGRPLLGCVEPSFFSGTFSWSAAGRGRVG